MASNSGKIDTFCQFPLELDLTPFHSAVLADKTVTDDGYAMHILHGKYADRLPGQ